MCFSTEASFIAAAVLIAAGTATMRIVKDNRDYFLAAIPFLFGIQQLFEGLTWLHLRDQIGSDALLFLSERGFLVFAFLIWPIWIPLSFAFAESVLWRKRAIFVLVFCGAALSALNLIYALDGQGVDVQIIGHSLQYMGHIPEQTFLYPAIVIFPMFLSSLKAGWMYGLALLAGFILADYYYFSTFTSVWCFFAALVSCFVYKIIKNRSTA